MVCIEPGDLIQAGCTSLVQRLKGSWRLNGCASDSLGLEKV